MEEQTKNNDTKINLVQQQLHVLQTFKTFIKMVNQSIFHQTQQLDSLSNNQNKQTKLPFVITKSQKYQQPIIVQKTVQQYIQQKKISDVVQFIPPFIIYKSKSRQKCLDQILIRKRKSQIELRQKEQYLNKKQQFCGEYKGMEIEISNVNV